MSYPEEYPKGFFCDKGVSAYGSSVLAKRPAGSQMLDLLQKGDHVLFWSVDRAFRNVGDFGTTIDTFRKRGINAHFISEGIDLSTASGQLRAAIMAVIAEHFSRMISFRTKEANAIKAIRNGLAPSLVGKKPRPITLTEFKESISEAEVATKVSAAYGRKKKIEVVDKIDRVWGYIRVSSDGQVESGLGLEAQRQKVVAACEGMDAQYMGMLEDEAISSFKVSFFNRPSGKRILNEAKRGDCIVVYRFDRIFRSLSDMIATVKVFREKGIVLKLVEEGIQTNSRDSDWYLSILGTFAEMESRIKGQRVAEALQFRKREGLVYAPCLTFFRPITVGNQRKYTLNMGRAVRTRMAHILWKEFGFQSGEAAHITNGLVVQRKKNNGVKDAEYVNWIFLSRIAASRRKKLEKYTLTSGMVTRTYGSWPALIDSIGPLAANRIEKIARQELAADITEPLLAFIKRTGISMDRFREMFIASPLRKPTTPAASDLGDRGVLLTGTEDL